MTEETKAESGLEGERIAIVTLRDNGYRVTPHESQMDAHDLLAAKPGGATLAVNVKYSNDSWSVTSKNLQRLLTLRSAHDVLPTFMFLTKEGWGVLFVLHSVVSGPHEVSVPHPDISTSDLPVLVDLPVKEKTALGYYSRELESSESEILRESFLSHMADLDKRARSLNEKQHPGAP